MSPYLIAPGPDLGHVPDFSLVFPRRLPRQSAPCSCLSAVTPEHPPNCDCYHGSDSTVIPFFVVYPGDTSEPSPGFIIHCIRSTAYCRYLFQHVIYILYVTFGVRLREPLEYSGWNLAARCHWNKIKLKTGLINSTASERRSFDMKRSFNANSLLLLTFPLSRCYTRSLLWRRRVCVCVCV